MRPYKIVLEVIAHEAAHLVVRVKRWLRKKGQVILEDLKD